MGPLVAAIAAFLVAVGNAPPLRRAPQAPATMVTAAAAAGAVGAARWAGLSWEDLGLGARGVAPGLLWGGVVAAAVGLAAALLAAVPGWRDLITDRRIMALDRRGLAARLLVRIPLGTAGAEEAAFRGALLGAWAAAAPLPVAVLGSSVVFGLWHVGATLDLLRANRPGLGPRARTAVVAGNVGVTAVGGVLFCLLRLATGGLVAPVLVHASVNVCATLTARWTGRQLP